MDSLPGPSICACLDSRKSWDCSKPTDRACKCENEIFQCLLLSLYRLDFIYRRARVMKSLRITMYFRSKVKSAERFTVLRHHEKKNGQNDSDKVEKYFSRDKIRECMSLIIRILNL